MLQDSMYPEDWARYYDDKFNDECRRRGISATKSTPLRLPSRVSDALGRLRYSRRSGCKADFNDERLVVEWLLSAVPCDHKWIETDPPVCEWCGRRG